MSPKVARWAERYCELGLAITRTPAGQKGPRHAGWNRPENAITDPQVALEHWSRNPSDGVAALLGPSSLVALDVDDEELAPKILEHFGIELCELRESAPCIVGRHYQLIFRAPDIALRHRSLTWPKKDHPLTSIVLFEFRAGPITSTLPPTIHPGTRLPYRWENPPAAGFPPLPARLREIWTDWDRTSREALALCPWYVPPPPPPTRPAPRRESVRPSVIDAFNSAHSADAILEAHGYRRDGKRFAAPDTSHDAGIVVLESGKVFCHHQGDPLASEHALDPFDLYRVLEHGGDYRAAVRAAAHALGLDRERAA